MIQLDEQLFLYLNTLGSESWDGFWLFMTDKFNMIPLYVVLLIYTFRVCLETEKVVRQVESFV